MLILPLFVLGIIFAFYLPALPFIYWVLAVLGWVIQTLTAFVASSLWAGAHGIPEGEGLAGNHARQGYLLFLGILIRPALMVFAFFLSYQVIIFAADLIGGLFGIFAVGMQTGFASGPVAMVSMITIAAALVIIAGHRVFGLVTWLPENVPDWFGGRGQNMGESEGEGRARGMMGMVVNRGEGVGGRFTAALADMDKQSQLAEQTAGGGGGGGGNQADAADLESGESGEY